MKTGLIDWTHDTGHLPAEQVAVQPLVGVDRDDRELLLVERPETTFARNSGTKDQTRLRSTVLTCRLASMTAK